MKLNKKGWLNQYIEARANLLNTQTHELHLFSSYPDQSLYRLLQPTGIMYGQNIGTWDENLTTGWDEKEKMKVLLAECFIGSSLLFHEGKIDSKEELNKVIDEAIARIGEFYNSIFPEISISRKTLLGKTRSNYEIAELILEKRVQTGTKIEKDFWINFFRNSLLFLDIFIFSKWIHTRSDKVIIEFFKAEKASIRFAIAKIIAAAAHSNMNIEQEERMLFEYFLEGAALKGEKRKEALDVFERGLSVNEIDVHQSGSWILKKYLLELAILTIWSDKQVEDQEHGFLKELCVRFELSDDDLENSLIAIEGFVLGHWSQMDYLRNREEFERMSEDFISRLNRVVQKNRSVLVREMKANLQLVKLLDQANKSQLSAEQYDKVREGLLKAMKTIPTFVVTNLPQSFLTLPVLLKILPQDLVAEVLA
ncbi:MAG TPA: hypothetical protein PKC24_00385 [Cyclobacteriaceae bacterium]|nr:hypothetical protein [Cyclobacteriaceae bacterium]